MHNHSNEVPLYLKESCMGPLRRIKAYSMYFVNDYRFHIHDRSEGNVTINSSVCVKSTDGAENDWYGILKKVIKVSLTGVLVQTVILFKCD